MTRLPEDMVREFHERFGFHVETTPSIPPEKIRAERARLIGSEAGEVIAELLAGNPDSLWIQRDIVDDFTERSYPPDRGPMLDRIAAEHGDLAYVNSGGAVNAGIPLTAVVAEVHAANMAKLGPDGKPIVNEHGKALKPEGWQPPDITAVLAGGLTGHILRVTADQDVVRLSVECHEPVGASCRRTCARPGCDWEIPYPHRDLDGTEHGLADQGECNAVLWMTEGDVPVIEYHDAPREEPLYDGMPIVVDWQGGDLVWRAVPVSTVDTGTPQAVTA